MFCPTCGKDNSLDLKFCASCGTNLHAVSQALTGREDNLFAKMDAGMDGLLMRYSERIFKRSPRSANGNRVIHSWQILGQSVITALLDLLLFTLMSTLLPIRLLMLVVSTPFRLLAERGDREEAGLVESTDYSPAELTSGGWRDDVPSSVTENTTTLFDTGRIKR